MKAEYFGPRLRELRSAAGLSQKTLAEKAGIGQSTVADLEQGRYDPTWSSVIALADALGVDCTAFRQPPTTESPQGPGRPSKAIADEAKPKVKKRKK